MKKNNLKILGRVLAMILVIATLFLAVVSCNGGDGDSEAKDFVSELKLDMNSSTLKQEVTVKAYIDGDTTHFYVPESFLAGGVLKARYLAINTPESTGKIEEWGKTASNFTKEKLQSATSIIIESDDNKWNLDSTGERYLVWVWYRSSESSEYRNLNVEILQNGLAIASNSANNRYGDTCMAAINQAKSSSLHVYSKEKDPNFPYGEATELTLKELRCNVKDYEGSKVAFEGVVVKNNSNTAYVEEYDAESGLYFGMTVYYGYALNGTGLQILSVGNRVRIVGTVQYYETGDSYQVSGLEYSPMRPKDPNNIQKISEGHSPAYVPTEASDLVSGKVELTVGDEKRTYDYAELALYTSREMRDLKVKSIYVTDNEESSSNGAMTLICEVDGVEISVRTIVLRDANGAIVTPDYFEDTTIDVKGLVDRFDGKYQIKVFSLEDINVR
ncbi:MAG: thermonuclease family protein [Clostridia bacterium]|nr:thermonuclease family protein [Clostridia bacterium]